MTRAELTDSLVLQCEGADLPLREKVGALRAALTRVQMNVSPGLQKPRRVEARAPLLRPSGKIMGKQKREAKE